MGRLLWCLVRDRVDVGVKLKEEWMSPRRFFGTDAGVGLLQTRHGQVKPGQFQRWTAHDGKARGSDPCEAGKSESSFRTLTGVLFLLGDELGNGKGDEVPASMLEVRVVFRLRREGITHAQIKVSVASVVCSFPAHVSPLHFVVVFPTPRASLRGKVEVRSASWG